MDWTRLVTEEKAKATNNKTHGCYSIARRLAKDLRKAIGEKEFADLGPGTFARVILRAMKEDEEGKKALKRAPKNFKQGLANLYYKMR